MLSWLRCPICGELTIGVCCDLVSTYLSDDDD